MITILVNGVETNVADLTPAGGIIAFGGATAPSGWLLCDGSAVSRSTYANLFQAIGTAYGSGDGVSTFNIPDFRGRFLRGVDATAGHDPDKSSRTAMQPGGNSGNNVGSVQGYATARPVSPFATGGGSAHTHTIFGGIGAARAMDNNIPVEGNGTGGGMYIGVIGSESSHTHQLGPTQGSGGDNETRPINAYVNYVIKT